MKKKFFILIFFGLLLTSCWKQEENIINEVTYKTIDTMIVSNTPISEQIKLIWKIVADQEVTVSSQISWIIENIFVSLWDKVTKDFTLAKIDTDSQIWVSYQNSIISLNNAKELYNYSKESIQKDIDAAELTLENAKINRDNVYSMTESQLNIAKQQLENILNTQENTLNTNNENLKSAEISVELAKESYNVAQTNLNNFKKNSQETKKTLLEKKISILRNVVSNLQNSYINLDQALNTADELLWVTDENENLNDSFEIYLWAKNTSNKNQTINDLKIIIWEYKNNISYINWLNEKFKLDIENIDFYENNWDYLNDLESNLTLIIKVKKILSNIIEVLNNSVETTVFTQSQIDAYKSNISLKQSSIIWSESTLIWLKNSLNDINNNISSNLTSIDTNKISLENALIISKLQLYNAKQSLDSLESNLESSIDNISWNVDLTKEQLNNTINSIRNSRDQADNAVNIAEIQLNSSKARLNSQLIQTKSQLDNSKWQTNLASVSYNNSIIKAPIDSFISSRLIEVWNLVNPWTPLFTLSTNDKTKISVWVTFDNVSNLKIWQEVKLQNFNWYTSTWIISIVSQNPDPNTNLYNIEIDFDNNILKSSIWEFINIYINKKFNKEGIMIPYEALENVSDWVFKVYVVNTSTWNLTNTWKVIWKEVELWLKNSTSVEITDWLKIWDIIANSKIWDLEDWEIIIYK